MVELKKNNRDHAGMIVFLILDTTYNFIYFFVSGATIIAYSYTSEPFSMVQGTFNTILSFIFVSSGLIAFVITLKDIRRRTNVAKRSSSSLCVAILYIVLLGTELSFGGIAATTCKVMAFTGGCSDIRGVLAILTSLVKIPIIGFSLASYISSIKMKKLGADATLFDLKPVLVGTDGVATVVVQQTAQPYYGPGQLYYPQGQILVVSPSVPVQPGQPMYMVQTPSYENPAPPPVMNPTNVPVQYVAMPLAAPQYSVPSEDSPVDGPVQSTQYPTNATEQPPVQKAPDMNAESSVYPTYDNNQFTISTSGTSDFLFGSAKHNQN